MWKNLCATAWPFLIFAFFFISIKLTPSSNDENSKKMPKSVLVLIVAVILLAFLCLWFGGRSDADEVLPEQKVIGA